MIYTPYNDITNNGIIIHAHIIPKTLGGGKLVGLRNREFGRTVLR